MERKTLVAIDFNNVVFASFYGQPLINSHGMNVNAVLSFFNKLKMLKDIYEPDFIVFASDLSREKTFRRQLYLGYKAQRKPMDESIREQMKYISSMVALLGFNTINNEVYEADDILGMISKYNDEHDIDTVIISSDRDLYQLVSEHTTIMPPRGDKVIDLAYMKETYDLTPKQWIEYKTLQGDKSDNIPGIQGIGPKTALQLLQDFGTIENIYNNLDIIRGKTKDLLIQGRDSLQLTKKLVTIVRDYSILGINENMYYRKETYPEELYRVMKYLETYSLFTTMKYSLLPQPDGKLKMKPTVE